MFKQKTMKKILLITTTIFLSSCSLHEIPPSEGGYYYKKVYFGAHFSANTKKGIRDGCTTAKGKYKKSHWLFNNSNDYNKGWFLGRNKCRNLLKIDKNGDLIL